MIVDCAIYDSGRRRPGQHGVAETHEASLQPDTFAWVGLYEPTEEEFAHVLEHFELHELAVEDAIHAHQRPKLEGYGDSHFLVLKTVRYDDANEAVDVGEILLFVGDAFVVAVRHGSASPLSPVRKDLEARPERLAEGPSAVVHAIIDKVVDDYLPVALELARDIDEVEAEVFSPELAAPTERIFKLKREVIAFHRAASPLVVPVQRMAEGRVGFVATDTREYFRDVHDHLLRVTEHIDTYRDLLNSILDANLTQVSVRQNEDMRRISAWVAIAAVPTMVAGIYGMNFENMPELNTRLGYYVVIGFMAAFCLALYGWFKRRGWL
ncbi:MAG: magnesium/cobalt transporter CorA [Acidimicrobiales bacterium]